jgi:polysaccharide export outer membrane protein
MLGMSNLRKAMSRSGGAMSPKRVVHSGFQNRMIQFLKSFLVGGLVLTVSVSACGPTNIQKPFQVADSTSSASEVNNALATLAMHTALNPEDYQIGAEDLLQITLFNVSAEETRLTPRTQTVRVSHKGFISLPLIGEVRVAGLTVAGLQGELKRQFDKYIYSPEVGVSVAEYRQRVSVIGSVQRTGVFELSGPKTVIDILAMAGGITDKAGTQVHIYRQGPNGRESQVIDLLALASNASLITANNASVITMPVQAGDVINVPAAGMFFVDGAVRRPGPYPLGRRYLLSQALATAGGVDRELSSSDIFIYRRKTPGEFSTMSVDLDAVLAGSAVDIQIEADDVILVPISAAKYMFNRYIAQIIFGGVSIKSFFP